MRALVAIVAACVIVGASAGTSIGPASIQHVRELLSGIFDDVGAILNSFNGGPNDPASPVTNATALNNDVARLNAASGKAQDLAAELQRIKDQASSDDR